VLTQVREQIATGSVGEVTASMRAVTAGAAAGALVPATEPPQTTVMPSSEVLGHYVTSQQQAFDGDRVNEYDGEDPHGDDHGPGIWPWLVGLLILLLIGGGVAAFLLTRPDKSLVPTVVGLPLQVAQTKIQEEGFTPNVLYENNAAQKNNVIGQSPLGGANVNSGSTVTLTVSEGPAQVEVPSVVQLSRTAATKTLNQAHLKVARILDENSGSIPKGEATRTDPLTGTPLSAGSGVTLYISSGPAPVSVPYVIGEKVGSAETALSKFKVTVQEQQSSAQQAGRVVSQTPTAGTTLTPGSPVTITVATAPPKTTTTTTNTNTTPTVASIGVPPVVGDTPAEARAAINAKGLKVTQTTQITPDASQAGQIVSQAPNAGRKVLVGSTVAIAIGRYQPTTGVKTETTPTTPTTPTKTTKTTPTTTTTATTPTSPSTTISTPATTPTSLNTTTGTPTP
jgi:serine/threonine-protein kinase